MTTQNFTQDVPQWIESASWQCITALLMLKNQSLTDDDVRGLHAAFHGFIAKHAPQPEAKEVAVLESMLANEEQACMEALEERDTAIGFCDLFAATILGEDINWSCHETKWQEALDMMSNGKTIEVSGIMLRRSGDHAIVEAEVDGKWKEVIREYIDAPFSHIVEPAGIADAKESELNSVPDGVEATPTTAATDAASGVERFIVNNNSVSTPGNGSYGSKKYLGAGTTLVLAADHDRLLAERDGEIVELKQKLADEERRGDLHADLNKRVAEAVGNPFSGPGSSWHDLPEKVAALRTRAEAAEAKCDAIRVQWQSLHDEREEQHAALRRRGIRFVKVGGVLEAIGADRELDMLKTPQSQADIDEAEEIAEGCVVNMENFDDVSSSEMHLVCTRLLNLREQQRRLQRHIRDKEAVIDELSGRCEKLAAEHAAALGLVADIRNALGDNGKRMQPELLVHCTQLAAANERLRAAEGKSDR